MAETIPLVSVCCTTYNQETYIRDAIEGFLMQRTTFPIEIIIHDDASTDNTANIVRDYAGRFPQLIFPIFQKENQYSKGIKPAAAYSWPKAKGKYIALCEGDDYWTDELKLQKQVDFLEANETVSFCFHNAQIHFCDKGLIKPFNSKLKGGFYTTNSLLWKGWIIPTASLVFRKECLPAPIPGWFHAVTSADYSLELLLSVKGHFYYLNDFMSVYRKNAINSLSLTWPDPKESNRRFLFLLRSFQKSAPKKNRGSICYVILRTKYSLGKILVYERYPSIEKLKTRIMKIARAIMHKINY